MQLSVFATGLRQRLEEELERIIEESENMLQRFERSYLVTESVMAELKNFIMNYPLNDMEEEIHFFKEIKPAFEMEFFYYYELTELEYGKPLGGHKTQKRYWNRQLEVIGNFFERNHEFYNYYRSGRTSSDADYFTRGETLSFHPGFDLDMSFSTVHSHKVAQLLAYEQLQNFVRTYIDGKDRLSPPPEQRAARKPLRWKIKQVHLIELGAALHEVGAFGDCTLKEVMDHLGGCFEIQLGNFYRVIQGMRIRKKTRTPFLQMCMDLLLRHWDNTDMNPR